MSILGMHLDSCSGLPLKKKISTGKKGERIPVRGLGLSLHAAASTVPGAAP